MYVTLKGYCDIQEKEATVKIDRLPSSALEDTDTDSNYLYGRMECDYISNGGQCDGRNCSILKNNGIKR